LAMCLCRTPSSPWQIDGLAPCGSPQVIFFHKFAI
jgi:hypothetical protein